MGEGKLDILLEKCVSIILDKYGHSINEIDLNTIKAIAKQNSKKHIDSNKSLLTRQDLISEWDYNLNSKDPKEYSLGQVELVNWICKNGHKYKQRIADRVYGRGCPYCAGQKAVKGETDLKSIKPDLYREIDKELNSGIEIEDLAIGSHKEIWWKCSKCNYRWKRKVYQRAKNGSGCPYCQRNKHKEKVIGADGQIYYI